MVSLIIVLLFLLIFRTSEGLWARARKPPWYNELKAVCVGAKDHYYVDDLERKCCKCSPCNWKDLPRKIDCYVPNNSNYCTGFASDCVYDDGFDLVFRNRPTTVSTTAQSVSPVITAAGNRTVMPGTPVQTQVGIGTSLIGIDDDVVNPVVVYGIMGIFVALVIVCVVILPWKYVKTRSSPLQKLMHICRGGKHDTGISQKTLNAESSQSNRKEVNRLVREDYVPRNESPRESLQSADGPPEMTINEFSGITSRNEVSREISSGSYDGSPDMQSGGGSDPSRRMSNDVGNIPQSVNSGTVISGTQNVVLMPNNRGIVHWNQPHITICMPRNNDSQPPVEGLPFGGNFCKQNEALGSNRNDYRLDQLHCSHSQMNSDADVRSEPCFPARADLGECVTSASPPLPRQEVGPGWLMGRQSSQISSTSAGPVENGAEDFQGGKSFLKEVSRSQDSHLPVYRTQTSTSIPTTSIRGSSSLRGPVQHSNRSDLLLRGNTSTGRQFPQGDSLSISTGIHSPQADLESF